MNNERNTDDEEQALKIQRMVRANTAVGAQGRFRTLFTAEQAAEAIAAREAGNLDNEQLKRIGKLSNYPNRDILYIHQMTHSTPVRDAPTRTTLFKTGGHDRLTKVCRDAVRQINKP
jgi:hypothetical protein